MRPTYETEEDLQRESLVIQQVESAWKCQAVKLSVKYSLDYALKRGDKVLSFCEIKTRNYTMADITKMGGYLLSLGKWTAAKQLSDSTTLPFMLVVKTIDGVYYSKFHSGVPTQKGVLFRGRTDRDDWQDVEPCVLLDTQYFVRL
jgi:hypothetical protein